MTSMIEQVSDSIFEVIWPASDWNGEELACRAIAGVSAKKAIEAMRQPTEELHAAAEDISVYYDDFSCGDGNITLDLPAVREQASYSAMIDAALKETAN